MVAGKRFPRPRQAVARRPWMQWWRAPGIFWSE